MTAPKLSPTDASSATTAHLFRRANGVFYARVRLPRSAGKGDHLQESLKTKDEREALRRLPHVAAKLLAERERLSRSPDGALKAQPKAAPKEAAAWAGWWRQRVIESGGDPDKGRVPPGLEAELDNEIERRLGRETGEHEDDDGQVRPTYDLVAERDAQELAAVAQGLRQPIAAELDRYLTERRLKARYEMRSRRAVNALVKWRRGRQGGDDLRRMDRREAGYFVDHLVTDQRVSSATANSLVSALSSYWKWMDKRGVAKGNPWSDQTRKATEQEAAREVRPFTDEEAKKLLAGKTNKTLHDLMRFGALTGMRINEIANLRTADVDDSLIHVRASKTAAGIRRVPVHADLKDLIARRTATKAGEAFLFDELKAPASRPTERSAKASERFTEYRRDLGVEELNEGQRNSSVNFHSWRHYFITKALSAGQAPEIVAAVVGHKSARSSVTLKTYNSTGPSPEQLKAVVDSVTLPAGAPVESPEGPLMNSGTRLRGRKAKPTN